MTMPSVEITVPSVEVTVPSALKMTSRSAAVKMAAPGMTAAARVTATARMTATAAMLLCCGDRRRQREYEHRRQNGFSADGLN
jgi:hypothetical protein